MSTRVGGREGAHVVEMQRRRLMLAIGELLAEGGVEDATVGRISKQAGVSRRTFYEIFQDSEDCFLASFEQAIGLIARDVVDAYARERKWSAGIRGGLTALLEHLDAHPEIAHMCVVETLRAGPKVQERRKRALSALTAAVDAGRAESKRRGEPPPLTAEGVVGGALSVVHARLLEHGHGPLIDLLGPLTAMILYPYLGASTARREMDRPAPTAGTTAGYAKEPFKDLSIRFTYRTALVLAAIATDSGASNRRIAESSGIEDDGQMSRLLRRLERASLVENYGEGQAKGEPNAWRLTKRGEAVHMTLDGGASMTLDSGAPGGSGRRRAAPAR